MKKETEDKNLSFEDGEDTIDILYYAGEINRDGYDLICECLENKKSNSALIVLGTPGGDPDAAFRIARALHHSYDYFDSLIPRYCKSAGTLLIIGANSIYMCNTSELGPLDIQLLKRDELFTTSSGLNILHAVNYTTAQSFSTYMNYLTVLTKSLKLSTKIASEMSYNLTKIIYSPLMEQIDPLKLAENERANAVGREYGDRLDEKGKNLKQNGLNTLIAKYPSHGFIIDRKEARKSFKRVYRPTLFMQHIAMDFHTKHENDIDNETPVVYIETKQRKEVFLHIDDDTKLDNKDGGEVSIKTKISPNKTIETIDILKQEKNDSSI